MRSQSLRGRCAVVTGGSRGFGLAVALAFASAGADLVLFARNPTELEQARATILDVVAACRVELCAGDVSKGADVERMARVAETAFSRADVLVCNAGVYGPLGPIEVLDFAEWAKAIEVNLHGVVLCARNFASQLKAAERGKLIVLSGGGATKPMPYMSAYAASKAAVVRFGETLAEEWKDAHVDVNMVAPGPLNTRLLDEVLEAGPDKVGDAFYAASLKQKETGGASLEIGAALCVYLASRDSDGITGKLISAMWDPWERFGEYRDLLDGSDVYTLRRIVPEERGLAW